MDFAKAAEQRRLALERLNGDKGGKSNNQNANRTLSARESKYMDKYLPKEDKAKPKPAAESPTDKALLPSPATQRVEKQLLMGKRIPKLPLGMLNNMPANSKAMMSRWSEASSTPVKDNASIQSTPRESSRFGNHNKKQGKLMRQKLKYIALQRAQTAVKGRLESKAASDMVKACEVNLNNLAAEIIQKSWRSRKDREKRKKPKKNSVWHSLPLITNSWSHILASSHCLPPTTRRVFRYTNRCRSSRAQVGVDWVS